MPYSPPPTFVAAAELAADELNVLSDDIAYLKAAADSILFSAVQLTRAASTSIANAVNTAITWTAEAFDFGGWWTSGTNIVVPAAAIPAGATSIAVQILARTLFAANGTGWRRVQVLVNGSVIGTSNTSAVNGETTDLVVPEFTVVEAGDIITFAVYQNSGGAINVASTQISVVRIGIAA